MAALDAASARGDIGPFAQFLAGAVGAHAAPGIPSLRPG